MYLSVLLAVIYAHKRQFKQRLDLKIIYKLCAEYVYCISNCALGADPLHNETEYDL